MVQSFTCGACGMLLSDPVDQCPICRDHFFWRAVPHGGRFDDRQRRAFVAMMQAVIGTPIEESFLTHGGHLWLPDTYWRHDPEGARLKELPWIVDLALHQHAAQPAPVAEPEPKSEPATVPEPLDAEDPADDSIVLFEEAGVTSSIGGPQPSWAADFTDQQDDSAEASPDASPDASFYLVDADDSFDQVPAAATPAWDQPTARVTTGFPTETVPLPVDDMFYSSPMIVDVETGTAEKLPVTAIVDPVELDQDHGRPMVVDGALDVAPAIDEAPFEPPIAPCSAPMVVDGGNQFVTPTTPAPVAAPAPVDPSLQRFFKEAETPDRAPTRSPSAPVTAADSANRATATLIDQPFFKPLMVFLLTMFLTLAHLTLCYYRNRQMPVLPPATAMQGETNAVLP